MAKKGRSAATKGVAENDSHTLDKIQQRAYELFEQDGYEHGRDLEHWIRAEAEISMSMSQKPSGSAKARKKK